MMVVVLFKVDSRGDDEVCGVFVDAVGAMDYAESFEPGGIQWRAVSRTECHGVKGSNVGWRTECFDVRE